MLLQTLENAFKSRGCLKLCSSELILGLRVGCALFLTVTSCAVAPSSRAAPGAAAPAVRGALSSPADTGAAALASPDCSDSASRRAPLVS